MEDMYSFLAVAADLCVECGGMYLLYVQYIQYVPVDSNCESGNRWLSHIAELMWPIGVHRLVSREEEEGRAVSQMRHGTLAASTTR